MRPASPGVWMAVTAVGAALLAAPAGALADVSIPEFSVVPSTAAAGAHPDVVITEAFAYTSSDGLETVKSTTLHFPPGLLGNPQATPKCAEAQFETDACSADTQVGSVTADVSVPILAIPVPLTPAPTGTIYNLETDPSHPGTLGIVLRPSIGDKIFLKSPISIRTSTDFGIDSPVDGMPNSALGFVNVRTDRLTLTLLGNPPGASAPFMSNPSSCKPATTTFDAVSYEAPGKTATAYSTFTPTDCGKLPFTPTVAATMGAPGATAKGATVPFTATVTQPPDQAAQQSATVTLPDSLTAATSGASLCAPDQFAASACPAATRIGTATIDSPLLPAPAQGPVYGLQSPVGLPDVGVQFGGLLPFSLTGATALGPNLRLQNVFTGMPDVPLTTFTLAIDGGPRGLLAASRDLCAGPRSTVAGDFRGQNGARVSVSGPVTVNGCAAARRAPRAKGSLRGLLGSHPRLALTVRKGAAPLRRVTITLPHGLVVRQTRRGVRAVAAAFKLGKRSIRLTRKGVLTLKLPSRGASRVTATLGGGSIVASSHVRAQLKKRSSVKLRFTIRTLDTQRRPATLHIRISGRR